MEPQLVRIADALETLVRLVGKAPTFRPLSTSSVDEKAPPGYEPPQREPLPDPLPGHDGGQ
jgi:hypothetical protein